MPELTDKVPGRAITWSQLSSEMEEYAASLEGEEEYLEGYEPEEDASKKKAPKGGSNKGKYKKSEGPFCGPSGGAPKGTFPVGTRKRAIAALAYRGNAANPSGIKKCVCRHWKDLPACKKKKDFISDIWDL